jgi:hypothetical protein
MICRNNGFRYGKSGKIPPKHSCLAAKKLSIKRLSSPLQPQWFSKLEILKSTLLFLVVLKTNYFCLASKLIHHSCDTEDTEKNV